MTKVISIPIEIEQPKPEVHVLAPAGTCRDDLRLGQEVLVTAWLQRFFDERTQIRGWERVRPQQGVVSGVVVGQRTLYSGRYVPARRHRTAIMAHRAVLVAFDLRKRPRYALTDDVEIVRR